MHVNMCLFQPFEGAKLKKTAFDFVRIMSEQRDSVVASSLKFNSSFERTAEILDGMSASVRPSLFDIALVDLTCFVGDPQAANFLSAIKTAIFVQNEGDKVLKKAVHGDSLSENDKELSSAAVIESMMNEAADSDISREKEPFFMNEKYLIKLIVIN